jgi:hypothetical protein
MWFEVHPNDFTSMLTVVMLSHQTLLYYNLYVNYIYEFQSEIIMMGVKSCLIAVKCQAALKDLRFKLYASCITQPLVLGDFSNLTGHLVC